MTQDGPKPRVFVASGNAGIELAYAIQANLENDVDIILWMESFSPGTPTFGSLFETLNSCDFAIMAISRVDLANQRFKLNLLFKIGLFVGTLGSERTFLVAPGGSQKSLPADLGRLNLLPYDLRSADLKIAIRRACRKIEKEVARLGFYKTWKLAESPQDSPSSTRKKKRGGKAADGRRTGRGPQSDDPERREVFVSYSHKDKKWLEKLRTLLVPSIESNTLFLWDDSMIKPGEEWEEKIKEALAAAKVAVLLVSPDFLASRFIAKNELPPLLDDARKIKILWVYLRACNYKSTEIRKYQAAHDIAKPLKARSSARQDQELLEICERITEAAQAK
jgi:predicted nucleotide-binding protein